MSITITSFPSFSPPRNEIDLALSAGQVMNAVSLYRVQNGTQTLVRQQPSVGFNSTVSYDYECPYGQTVTYSASGTYLSSTTVTEWTEPWANTSSWTGPQLGTASVSGGVVSFTNTNDSMYRSISSGNTRVTVASMLLGSSITVYVGTTGLTVSLAATTVTVQIGQPGGAVYTQTGTYTTSNVQIDIVGTLATVTVGSNTWTYTATPSPGPTRVYVYRSGAPGAWGGQVVASAYSATSVPWSFTSSPVTLTAASGWMIHPATPALSVPISTTDRTLPGVSSLGPVTQASTATVHEILGSSTPVVSTTGPRLSDSLSVGFIARTLAHESALLAVTRDQTPLLIRFPDTGLDWKDGFYSVGDVVRTRFAQVEALTRRDFALSLRLVQSPTVTVQNPGWSWAGVASAFTSWNQAVLAYNTWADMEIDNRNPGF